MDLIGTDISIDEIEFVPDDSEFKLDSILAEFAVDGYAASSSALAETAAPSKPIVLAEDEGISAAELSSVWEPEAEQETTPESEYESPPDYSPETASDPELPQAYEERVTEHDFPKADEEDSSEAPEKPVYSGMKEPIWNPPAFDTPKRGFVDTIAAPFISLLALIMLRKQQRGAVGTASSDDAEEDLGPEADPESASKYYSGNIKSLRLRLRISIFLSIILIWISFGLPVAGLLRSNPTVLALMCLILELTVVMLGLDIFTAGMMSLVRMKPSLWSLVSISCFAAALDAVVTAAFGSSLEGLPFCAVASVSMAFAIAGSLQTCRGFRLSLKALALSRNPYSVSSEAGVAEDGITLLKSRRDTMGFVRRCEEPDCAESAYGSLAIFLLAGALLLSLLAALLSSQWKYFFRIFAAITAPCAPFAAFLAFPLPYSIITHGIFRSGAAIAGWSGLRDIGSAQHLIVTDRDIFPADTVSIESVRILEGTWPEKVISCTGSVICASGSGLAPVFADLMRRNNCSIQRVEDFCCHEGGGLTAMINGEEVLCGNSGFMHLMGIRLPQKLASKSSVFVSINGVLTGIFTIKYIPVTSVQDALANLLHSRRKPIFAIRDFNITPLMIRKKFRMPTDGFDFPAFAKRYEISQAEPSPDSLISAVISREGLGPLVEVSERGRKLYLAVRLSTILSLLCTFVGVLLMFSLCVSGSFDSATAGNMLTYMFLWLVPIIVLTLGLGR